ncbi:MAG: HNH endonuclease signature motif containing protein [Chloroflexota bacterium]
MTSIPDPLRRAVLARANRCCEYCLLSQDDAFLAHEVDHVIAEKHRGVTTLDNLCLSCFDCNRHKGSDIASVDPETGALTPLFDPRRDRWTDHFRLEGPRIVPRTAIGRVTEYLLRLNSDEQIMKRAALIALGRYPPAVLQPKLSPGRSPDAP